MGLLSYLTAKQKVVSLPPNASVLEASKKMKANNVGSVVVMENDRLIGIFSERDLLFRVAAQGLDMTKTTLAQVMTKNVSTIHVDDSLQNCFKKMEAQKCRRLPITDNGNKVVGMVTMRNILECLVKEIEDENNKLKQYIQS